ncbi:DUF4288 domain-containing protein [Coraliomargarita sp. W4R53]
MNPTSNNQPWFAVRCLFSHPKGEKDGDGTLYEERITLWKCDEWQDAYIKAEQEAKEYEKESNCIFIRATDSFHLFDEELKEGTEVWSTMRGSFLNADTYENTFCVTSRDRDHEITIERETPNKAG